MHVLCFKPRARSRIASDFNTPSLARAVMMMMRKKGSLILLKLGTLKVNVKLIFLNFDFWRENFLMGLKIDFEFFEVGQIY